MTFTFSFSGSRKTGLTPTLKQVAEIELRRNYALFTCLAGVRNYHERERAKKIARVAEQNYWIQRPRRSLEKED